MTSSEWQQRTVCPGLLQAPGALLPVDGRRRLARNLPTAPTHLPSLTPVVQDPVIPLSQPPHDTII